LLHVKRDTVAMHSGWIDACNEKEHKFQKITIIIGYCLYLNLNIMKSGIFILLQLIFFTCFAQQYSYRHYTIFDGLPQNQVTRVYQRGDGILFYSTKGEAGGFDGNRFRNYKDKYISESALQGFLGVGKSIYWYTQKALVRFESKQSYLIASFDSIPIHSIKLNVRLKEVYVIFESAFMVFKPGCKTFIYKNDSLKWLSDVDRIPGSSDFLLSTFSGIHRLNKRKELTKLIEGQGAQILSFRNKLIFQFIREEGKYPEFGGIYSYDGEELQKIYAFGNNVPGGVLTKTANDQMIFVQNNSTWIRIDTSGHVVDSDSIPDVILTDIIEDSNGHLFIGSENGLWHQQSYAFRNYDWRSTMPRYVWSIFEDKDSSLVFATYHGQLFKMKNNILSEVKGYRESMAANEVFYMQGFCNSLGQWMIPTNYRIFVYDHGKVKFLPLLHEGNFSTCLATYEDAANHTVYFGTTNGLFIYDLISEVLKRIDTKGGNTLAIEKDKHGHLWICTNKNVLLLKNDSSFNVDESPVNTGVISCRKDPQGNMWYAKKDGLYFYNYKRHLKICDGHFYFISLWKNSKIIAGGIEGITVIDLKKLYNHNRSALQTFDRFNGFIGIECGQNGTLIDSRGNVWIPTSESVVQFKPERAMYDTNAPMPYFVSFEYSSIDLLWKEISIPWLRDDILFELEPKRNNIRIVFDGLDYISRERITFRYRLLGYSDIWKESKSNEAVFTNLSPGNYKFELLVANENGYWSKTPRVLLFRIKPALVQTIGFKIFIILLNLAIIVGIVFLIMRKKQIRKDKEKEVERELVAMQVKTINAQLDPHFIFNTITAIGSEVQEKNHDKAYAYFVKVSQLLRNSLKNSDKITRTLDEEMQFVSNYLSLQKFRFEDRFSYDIFIDPNVNLQITVPKMCVQIFVENAMKHGIEQLASGGLLKISISKNEKGNIFMIEDNGIGREASARLVTHSNGLGLQVFKEFFEIMNRYNIEIASFVIHDLFDEKGKAIGTRVELFIPDDYSYVIQ